MDRRLLDILVCPICKSQLRYDRQRNELICTADRLAYPIKDGIPIMLESAARELSSGEQSSQAAVRAAATGHEVAP